MLIRKNPALTKKLYGDYFVIWNLNFNLNRINN